MRWTAWLAAAALVLPVVALASPVPAPADEPTRILIYGDSISQGSTGDWTWRYFVDRHLRDAGSTVDFVGPRPGLRHFPDASGNAPDDQEYADPAFDSDSATVWGQALTQPTYALASSTGEPDLVTEYAPAVVVALIGQNDLAYLHRTPDELADTWRATIATARAHDPDIDFVLVQVPDVWFDGVPAYNSRLVALGAELDQSRSRVVTTDLAQLDPEVDTWDGAHPTASGEIKIARVVENGLARVGLGMPPGMIPVAANGPQRAATLRVTPGVGRVTLTWDAVPGVDREWLEQRDVSAGAPWTRFPYAFSGAAQSWTPTGLVNGHRYEYRLRPAKGTAIAAAVTSPVVSEVPGVRPAAPAPAVVRVDAGGHVVMTWPAVAAAASYAVSLRDVTLGTGWGSESTLSGPQEKLSGLLGGHTYELRVRADNGLIRGETSTPVRLTVPRLGPVSRVTARSPRRDRVRTGTAPVAFATGYRLAVARARSCRTVPRSAAFRTVGPDTVRRTAIVTTKARAIWVRWTAVRGAAVGKTGPTSSTCTRVK